MENFNTVNTTIEIMTKEEKQKINAAEKRLNEWVSADETWNNDLDGYSGGDLAEAVIRRAMEEIRFEFEN